MIKGQTEIRGSGKGVSMRAGAAGRGFMQEGHPAHNGLAICECMGSRKAGKWFREQRSRGRKLKFMVRQSQEQLE